jgi:diguanylate cyclase (GGDEF)-like protein/PAS domain S-box-containing protein
MNTQHGYIYLSEPDGSGLVCRVGTGHMAQFVGYRLERGVGIGGTVWQTGQPMVVDDYDAWTNRAGGMPLNQFGAVIGVPLTSGPDVVGVIGLASGSSDRTFGGPEINVLGRFAQLASIALDNAKLLEKAQLEVVERRRAEVALRVSEERLQRLSDATTEPVAIARDAVFVEVNQAMSELLGYPADEIVGRRLFDFLPAERQAQIMLEPRPPLAGTRETVVLNKLGETVPVQVTWRPIPYGADGQANVLAVRDLREQRSLEQRLTMQAITDRVTGLPNRDLLVGRLGQALGREPAFATDVGLVLLDVDRFQSVNERLGHGAGDQLLVLVGERIAAALRPGDVVARFGGDEFGILLEAVPGPDEARSAAERIAADLREPFSLGGNETFVTVSMGVVVGRPGQCSVDDILRDAEIALHQAKAEGGASVALFETSMMAVALERIELEHDLRVAIERDELSLHYQPIVDLQTQAIVGFEALARWQHPIRGAISPLDFIPRAEATGLILPIGSWVLETACREACSWQLANPAAAPLLVSVNLSARQFAQPDLVQVVASILERTGIDPRRVELEITESIVMEVSAAAIRALAELRALGVRIVLDDFGTGYSSLSYLKHLPLDTIKIDRSFVSGLPDDDADLSIVRAVVALAHGLGIGVVAEGIETLEQHDWLRRAGCDRGQGFMFARPQPPENIPALLSAAATHDPEQGQEDVHEADVQVERGED